VMLVTISLFPISPNFYRLTYHSSIDWSISRSTSNSIYCLIQIMQENLNYLKNF